MTKNGNTNGYVQVFEGPNGEPMVVLRATDFFTLLQSAQTERDSSKKKSGYESRIFSHIFEKIDMAQLEEISDLNFSVIYDILERHTQRVRVSEESEDTADAAAIRETKAALASGDEEFVPGEIAKRLIAGEQPVKVWREYRGLTQKQLFDATGVDQGAISKIENGKRTGDVETLKALADGLGVLVDDLVL